MGKLKVGDSVEIVSTYQGDPRIGEKAVVNKIFNNGRVHVTLEKSNQNYSLFIEGLKVIYPKKNSTESQSKQIKQALKQIITSGLVIKSEKIIDKVKQKIGTGNVFGDTILRGLRQLRSDGVLDYTADKQTREYTFK